MLPKRVGMGFMIGVRFIESGKNKRVVIISEIRGRNAYPNGTTKFRTNRRLRRGWFHRVQDKQAYHMLGIKLEMSRLERQPMSKNPPQVQDREGGKDQ